jgi:outer membrane protein assembly factor BamB
VFFVTSDAHLVALNRKTGGGLWDRQYADTSRGAFATLAPMVVKDRVIVGVSGGDTGCARIPGGILRRYRRRVVALLDCAGQRRTRRGNMG